MSTSGWLQLVLYVVVLLVLAKPLGSYMAAVAAQPVFRLLGAKGLGVSDDYKTEKMPAVNVSLLDGQLAWRQHDGGHTDGPNWKYFIPWADKFLNHSSSVTVGSK